MYLYLLFFHSLVRWLALTLIVLALYRAARGYFQHRVFSRADNALRHWTATVSHLQLVIGILLYLQGPLTAYFWQNFGATIGELEISFFGFWHPLFMLTSIVLLTIGSALAKRKESDREKFKTILIWFGIALLILLLAIPWPFSPFAQRPYYHPL